MNLYVIECRTPDGRLDLTGAQPESVFGMKAITGITEDEMAKRVFDKNPDAVLTGMNIPTWPAYFDVRWIARRKTW